MHAEPGSQFIAGRAVWGKEVTVSVLVYPSWVLSRGDKEFTYSLKLLGLYSEA